MNCNEAQELITASIDQELAGGEQAVLQRHLEECIRCRRQLEVEQTLKQKTRAAGEDLTAPVQLRERILSDRRIFPRSANGWSAWRDYVGGRVPRQTAAIAALVVLALPFLHLLTQSRPPVAVALLESSDLFLNNRVPLIRASTEKELIAQLVEAVGGSFQPMGYDLTALNMKPIAGTVREIAGRKILLALYRSPDQSLLCYTFVGSEQDAPAHAAKFVDHDKKMTLFAFSHGSVNAVLHREGELICILAAEMPLEDLLALTKSMARPS